MKKSQLARMLKRKCPVCGAYHDLSNRYSYDRILCIGCGAWLTVLHLNRSTTLYQCEAPYGWSEAEGND